MSGLNIATVGPAYLLQMNAEDFRGLSLRKNSRNLRVTHRPHLNYALWKAVVLGSAPHWLPLGPGAGWIGDLDSHSCFRSWSKGEQFTSVHEFRG